MRSSWSTYTSRTGSFFSLISGTGFYKILHQYYYCSGGGKHDGAAATYCSNHKDFLSTTSQLMGSHVDTRGYGNHKKGGKELSSVTTGQVLNEVKRVVKLMGWHVGHQYQYNIFLGDYNTGTGWKPEDQCAPGACFGPDRKSANESGGNCAYHDQALLNGGGFHRKELNYVIIPYGLGYAKYTCRRTGEQSPSGDWNLDVSLNVLNHETFETVTDPNSNNHAWLSWGNHHYGYENADECRYRFTGYTSQNPDANQIWSGQKFSLQDDWSDQAAASSTDDSVGCVHS